ncbi:type II CRISPR-associated endonuclease Cas1 [uncultured Eubacterium sp.]|uniref:type II CRISPR-associated endonuclease Cas1 n=1 Tax=uncultured Eubacterium sp. TaxID=165185 RepID=UPI00260989B7|nr:type II CRISPR-associated endonuclease Cas1 [uncultured Eubacterium sp.]
MAYRNIFIANEAKLKLKNNQLIVFNGEELSFPIEDIRSIVVDNPYTSLTGKLIAKLADDGVCLIICNDKHIPSCELLPIGSYCRMNKRINLQFSQSKPRLKKIWQKIVQAKINNQAKCLELNEIDEAQTLYSISKNVASGDTTNREGYAARLYFKSLFGGDFKRDDENSINAALNYGYAIFRSFIAKTIIAYGLEPSLGIHHKSQLNQFNLADDIIEPYRPIIDNFVYQNYVEWGEEFFTPQKAELQLLLNCATEIDGNRHSVANAIELTVQSIISSFENEEIALKLPNLIDISYFNYD